LFSKSQFDNQLDDMSVKRIRSYYFAL